MQIEEMGINISPEHEYKVIKEKTMSIEEQNETLREEVSSLKDRCGQIKGLLDKETGKREEDVEVLKKEINKKESQIKEVSEFIKFFYNANFLHFIANKDHNDVSMPTERITDVILIDVLLV